MASDRTIVRSQAEADKILKERRDAAYNNTILATRQEYEAAEAARKKSIKDRLEKGRATSGRLTTILAGENRS